MCYNQKKKKKLGFKDPWVFCALFRCIFCIFWWYQALCTFRIICGDHLWSILEYANGAGGTSMIVVLLIRSFQHESASLRLIFPNHCRSEFCRICTGFRILFLPFFIICLKICFSYPNSSRKQIPFHNIQYTKTKRSRMNSKYTRKHIIAYILPQQPLSHRMASKKKQNQQNLDRKSYVCICKCDWRI